MLRAITEVDRPIISEWISRDPEHSAKGMTEEFFRQPDSINFAADDKRGPVMYIRVEPLDAEIVRLHIQFNDGEHRRTALTLARGFPIVRDLVRKSGIRYIVFDSVSEPLIQFCQKHFGFVHIPDSNDYFIDLKG
jgi:hypothetical protein